MAKSVAFSSEASSRSLRNIGYHDRRVNQPLFHEREVYLTAFFQPDVEFTRKDHWSVGMGVERHVPVVDVFGLFE